MAVPAVIGYFHSCLFLCLSDWSNEVIAQHGFRNLSHWPAWSPLLFLPSECLFYLVASLATASMNERGKNIERESKQNTDGQMPIYSNGYMCLISKNKYCK